RRLYASVACLPLPTGRVAAPRAGQPEYPHAGVFLRSPPTGRGLHVGATLRAPLHTEKRLVAEYGGDRIRGARQAMLGSPDSRSRPVTPRSTSLDGAAQSGRQKCPLEILARLSAAEAAQTLYKCTEIYLKDHLVLALAVSWEMGLRDSFSGLAVRQNCRL